MDPIFTMSDVYTDKKVACSLFWDENAGGGGNSRCFLARRFRGRDLCVSALVVCTLMIDRASSIVNDEMAS